MAAVSRIDLLLQGHTAFVEVTDGSSAGDKRSHCHVSTLNTYQQFHDDGFYTPPYHPTLNATSSVGTLTGQSKAGLILRMFA
jgi:hypothetical protein